MFFSIQLLAHQFDQGQIDKTVLGYRSDIVSDPNQRSINMLNYVITFFLLAVLAAVLGFGGLAGTFAQIAQILAMIFVVLFLASLIRHLLMDRQQGTPTL